MGTTIQAVFTQYSILYKLLLHYYVTILDDKTIKVILNHHEDFSTIDDLVGDDIELVKAYQDKETLTIFAEYRFK